MNLPILFAVLVVLGIPEKIRVGSRMGNFVHLHNHSHYSLQDAAATVPALVAKAQEYEQPALALTDHGVMFGCSEFTKKASKAGIKPILGMESYITMSGSRFEKKSAGGRKQSRNYNHLILLAKTSKGYENLIKLCTIGFTEGFYYKPRIDLDILRQHSEGIICTSACAGGPVAAPVINNDIPKAKENALIFKEIFGDDFYLEIMDHGLDIEKPMMEWIPQLSKELDIKLIATNDIHYIEQEHSIAHNILLNLGDKSGNVDYKNLRYRTDQVYFKSTEQMQELFKDYPDALENTLEIADKVDFKLGFSQFHYPIFPIPEESGANNLDEYFTLLARQGLEKRYNGVIPPEVEERFNYEIGVITSMGYSGYFLITQDFINAAKDMGIPVGPGRGSAAGSLVSYAMRITNINPMDYDLLFERFLNPARKSMPDIDVDFADDQRGEVIEYTKHKYGEDSVCQIITFNRLSSKAVLRDVARVLQIPIPVVNSITKHIPTKFGRVFTIEQALDEVPELEWVNKSDDPKIHELIKYGKILEGMNRNSSKHAAGVVITPGPVSNFVPLAKAGGDGDLVTQYNMKELDDAGLLKMDFLGLRTLTIIRDAIELAKVTHNLEEYNIDDIPLDDQKTYELFARGQTTAVFQFESGAMREYLKNLKPTSIKDLSAMNALYRPGPMEFIDDFIDRKHGRKPIEYLHPNLEPILKETYGIIIYQEQVIKIANVIAGMSLAEADILRRAMGKKDLEAMAEQKKKFIAGAVENGIKKETAEEIFVVIDKFANYGFNKSHAVAYSVVAYQTAYLKAHFLPEFLAANLTNEFGNTDKVTMLLDDARRLKVKVLPPDVNNPFVKFGVADGKIIFGMSAIKNVGIGAVEEIMRKRKEIDRPFTSIYDLCANVDTRLVNKRVLEGLVLAGAFDTCKGHRAQNYAVVEDALNFGAKTQQSIKSQSSGLFGGMEEMEIPEPDIPDIEPWSDRDLLQKEREVLGFYLSDHPLRKYLLEYNSFAKVHLGEPTTFENKDDVMAVGVVTSMRTKIDKSGNQMAFFKLDDFTGSCECIMFSKIYKECVDIIKEENTVVVHGRPESSGDAIKIHADEAVMLDESVGIYTKKLLLNIVEGEHTIEHIEKLKKLFESNPGSLEVFLKVKNNGFSRAFMIEPKISLNNDIIDEISGIVGRESIRLLQR